MERKGERRRRIDRREGGKQKVRDRERTEDQVMERGGKRERERGWEGERERGLLLDDPRRVPCSFVHQTPSSNL